MKPKVDRYVLQREPPLQHSPILWMEVAVKAGSRLTVQHGWTIKAVKKSR